MTGVFIGCGVFGGGGTCRVLGEDGGALTGDGLFSVAVILWMEAMAACGEERKIIATWSRNHASVSTTHAALVPQIHTR
jgi:hypothetical protein